MTNIPIIDKRNYRSLINNNYIRSASQKDYEDWYIGFIQNGNIPNRFQTNFTSLRYEYWMVVMKDFILQPLYGADSLQLIVPKNKKVEIPNGIGHNEILYMKNFMHTQNADKMHFDCVKLYFKHYCPKDIIKQFEDAFNNIKKVNSYNESFTLRNSNWRHWYINVLNNKYCIFNNQIKAKMLIKIYKEL